MTTTSNNTIKALDVSSIHKINSGQVVIDLQTAVKELVENSLDAGATSIEVRFKEYGLRSLEVIDNGSGISSQDYDTVALKHHTSKLSSFTDLSTVTSFGFRGEALSALCALCESANITTATANDIPMGSCLELGKSGQVVKRSKIARQRGTTVTIANLFTSLPVRRKEFERNCKREYGKALTLLHAYALIPCTSKNVRLTVTNQLADGARKPVLKVSGASLQDSLTSIWGPKGGDQLVPLDLSFTVDADRNMARRIGVEHPITTQIRVTGLISKFTHGAGRTGSDRQFFFINGRPCNIGKIQKTINEVYKSFNTLQVPCVVADFIIPTDAYDINVSPDKRTIFLHSEKNLIICLKAALEDAFAESRSTFSLSTNGHSSAMPSQSSEPPRPTRVSDPPDVDVEMDATVDTAPDMDTSDVTGISVSIANSKSIEDPEDTPRSPNAVITMPDSSHSDVSQPLIDKGPAVRPKTNVNIDVRQNRASTTPAPRDRSASAEPLFFPSPSPPPRRARPDLGSNSKVAPNTPPSSVPPIQVILDTTGTSWNPARSQSKSSKETDSPTKEPPAKKIRLDSGKKSSDPGLKARRSMRTLIDHFARAGSQRPSEVEDNDPESEEDQLEYSDDKQHAKLPSASVRRTYASDGLDDDGDIDMATENEPSLNSLENGISVSKPLQVTVASAKPTTSSSPDVIDLTETSIDVDTFDAQTTPAASHTDDRLPEIIRSDDEIIVTVRCELKKITDQWRVAVEAKSDMLADSNKAVVGDEAGIANVDDNEQAAQALSRVIAKDDFASMEILGQFNKGFIITRRRAKSPDEERSAEVSMDDLFIIDQHASDEKYNFETLQQTTVIDSQRLIRPQRLQLSAADELLVIDHLDILKKNGFEVTMGDDDSQNRWLDLVAQPVSKNTNFDMKDLEEILHLLHDEPNSQVVRCSKARAMFASRACRKSVMIGMALSHGQMKTIVKHMGTLDQPWACPHGRPTMRHLVDLSTVPSRPARHINWGSYAPPL